MNVAAPLVVAYLDRAFDQMLAVLERVDADQLTTAPVDPSTTSISGLVTHCTEMCEFWLGHVGLGEPSDRDRSSEFTHRADRGELRERIATARAAARHHLLRLAAGEGQPSEWRGFLYGDRSDDSLVLHVLEELYQHLGHLDLTADVLVGADRGRREP